MFFSLFLWPSAWNLLVSSMNFTFRIYSESPLSNSLKPTCLLTSCREYCNSSSMFPSHLFFPQQPKWSLKKMNQPLSLCLNPVFKTFQCLFVAFQVKYKLLPSPVRSAWSDPGRAHCISATLVLFEFRKCCGLFPAGILHAVHFAGNILP